MSDLEPLLRGEATEIEEALLRSVDDDAPRDEARHAAMAAALGAAGSVSMAPAAAAVLKKSWFVKWIGVGAGVVAVGYGGLTAVRATRASGPFADRHQMNAAHVLAPRGSASAAPHAEAPEDPVAQPPTPVTNRQHAKPQPSSSSVESPSGSSSVTEELAVLDSARRALLAHDAATALAAVDEHDRKFPRGALGQEATLLRVRALVLRGDRGSAAAIAHRFVAAHPSSRYSKEMRALLGDENL